MEQVVDTRTPKPHFSRNVFPCRFRILRFAQFVQAAQGAALFDVGQLGAQDVFGKLRGLYLLIGQAADAGGNTHLARQPRRPPPALPRYQPVRFAGVGRRAHQNGLQNAAPRNVVGKRLQIARVEMAAWLRGIGHDFIQQQIAGIRSDARMGQIALVEQTGRSRYRLRHPLPAPRLRPRAGFRGRTLRGIDCVSFRRFR